MPSKSKKGAAFERAMCKELSLWITEGKSDNALWRSAGSGSRATIRGRGDSLVELYGDVSATAGGVASEFIRNCVVELKRGYPMVSLDNLVSLTEEKAEPSNKLRQWVQKLQQEVNASPTQTTGMLIWKPDRKPAVVFLLNWRMRKNALLRIPLPNRTIMYVVRWNRLKTHSIRRWENA